MKTIIVPLDLSDESIIGLNLAIMMAAKTGADILLVNVIGKYTGDYYDQMEKEKQSAQSRFELILHNYKENANLKSKDKKLHQYADRVASYLGLRIIAEDIWTLGAFSA